MKVDGIKQGIPSWAELMTSDDGKATAFYSGLTVIESDVPVPKSPHPEPMVPEPDPTNTHTLSGVASQ